MSCCPPVSRPPRATSTEDLATPFVEALKSVLATMLQAHCTTQPLERVCGTTHQQEVSAVITLTGDLSGEIIFSTTTAGARQVLERMTGMEVDGVDEFVRDAVGEIANMVAGYGKRDLERYQLRLGLPQVTVEQAQPASESRWTFHYWTELDTEIGPCVLEIGFDTEPA